MLFTLFDPTYGSSIQIWRCYSLYDAVENTVNYNARKRFIFVDVPPQNSHHAPLGCVGLLFSITCYKVVVQILKLSRDVLNYYSTSAFGYKMVDNRRGVYHRVGYNYLE